MGVYEFVCVGVFVGGCGCLYMCMCVFVCMCVWGNMSVGLSVCKYVSVGGNL